MFKYCEERVNINHCLGTGAYGKVFPYQKSSSDTRYVVKRISVKDFKHLKIVIQEIVLGFDCTHPALLPIIAYDIQENTKKGGWYAFIKMKRMKKSLRI